MSHWVKSELGFMYHVPVAEGDALRAVAEAAVAWKAVVGRRDPRFRLDVLALYDAVTAHEALLAKAEPDAVTLPTAAATQRRLEAELAQAKADLADGLTNHAAIVRALRSERQSAFDAASKASDASIHWQRLYGRTAVALAAHAKVVEAAVAWMRNWPAGRPTNMQFSTPLYDAVTAYQALLPKAEPAPAPAPVTVWKVVRRTQDVRLTSVFACNERLRTYAPGVPQTMRSMAFSTEVAAKAWWAGARQEVWRAEAETATAVTDDGFPPHSLSCTNLRLVERVWPAAEPEPAPTCKDCGTELPAIVVGLTCYYRPDGPRVCDRCYDERKPHKCADCGKAFAATDVRIECNGGSILICQTCHDARHERLKKAERLRAHAARVTALLEEHAGEGAEFQYGKGGMWFGGDRAPFEPESVGWVRWTDAAGDVHTIEFQGAGNG